MPTLKELEDELASLKEQSAEKPAYKPGIVESLFGGYYDSAKAAVAGGIASLPKMGQGIAEMGLAAVRQSPQAQILEKTTGYSLPTQIGTPTDETIGMGPEQYPNNKFAYSYGTGAVPGAIAGAAAGAPGGLPGMAAGAAVGGTLGGLENATIQQMFPSSELLQGIVGALAPAGYAGVRNFKNAIPKIAGPKTDPVTGLPLTQAEYSNNKALGLQQKELESGAKTAGYFEDFEARRKVLMDDYTRKLQSFDKVPDTDATNLVGKVTEAVDTHNKGLVDSFKKQNKVEFNLAKEVPGTPIVTKPVVEKMNQLIDFYSSTPETPGHTAMANNLARLRDGLTAGGKKSSNVSIAELQTNLNAWGDTVYSGKHSANKTSYFEDVAPGTSKYAARQILRAWGASMDDAIDAGVEGASLLKKARTSFKTRLDELDASASQPLIKRYDKRPESLVPEDEVKYLISLPPSQRVVYANVLGEAAPDVLASTRALGYADLLKRSRTNGELDTKRLYSILKTEGNDLAWMFPSKEEQAGLVALTDNLKSIERRASYLDHASTFERIRRVGGETSGAFAGAVGKYGFQTIADLSRMLVTAGANSPTKIAIMMTDPNGAALIRELAKPRPNLSKIPSNYLDSLLTTGGFTAATTGGEHIQEGGGPPTLQQMEQELQQLRNSK